MRARFFIACALAALSTPAFGQAFSGFYGFNYNYTAPTPPLGDNSARIATTAFVLANAGLGTLPNNQIFVGNASNVPIGVTMSGDCTIVAAGAITCTKTNGTNFATIATSGSATDLSTGTVAAARMPAHTGDVTSSAGTVALTIGTNVVTDAKFRQSVGISLVGRSANSTGNTADIQASAPNQVARLDNAGTTLGFGAVNLASTNAVTGALGIANGGTAQTTAAAARASTGLNVEAFRGVGDGTATITASDRVIGTNAVFTASRTWTLPAASAVNPGQSVIIADFQGTVTGTNTLVIQRAGGDTINGGASVTINVANGGFLLISDGTSKWT